MNNCGGVFTGSDAHRLHEEKVSSSSSGRVVLIVDLWHPDLTLEERSLLRDLYPEM